MSAEQTDVNEEEGIVHESNETMDESEPVSESNNDSNDTEIKTEDDKPDNSSTPTEADKEPITKIYVGNLKMDQDEKEIEQLFSTFGELTQPPTITRGFTFVFYKKEEDALLAIEKLNGSELGGRTLKVEISHKFSAKRETKSRSTEESKNLFVAGLPLEITEDEFTKIFEAYGTVTGIHLHPKKT